MGHGIVNIGGAPKHASRHAAGAADAITPGDIGAAALVHKARHATGGADALAPGDIGAAELVDGVIKTQQARTRMIEKIQSYTLDINTAEAYVKTRNTDSITITIPADTNNEMPDGTSFMIIRFNTGAVNFYVGVGASVLMNGIWYTNANGTIASISANGAKAFIVKMVSGAWTLECQ